MHHRSLQNCNIIAEGVKKPDLTVVCAACMLLLLLLLLLLLPPLQPHPQCHYATTQLQHHSPTTPSCCCSQCHITATRYPHAAAAIAASQPHYATTKL